ncbi:MAG: hypothetical protein CL916_04035 [Deltaproteobacteria bacterium]|nr:hypothetical protein [Deltaproteobacteria bacterium]
MKYFLLGPFAQKSRVRRYLYILVVLILLTITQLGAIWVWPFLAMNPNNIGWKHRTRRLMYPLTCYIICSQFLLPILSPLWGMKALSCSSSSHLRAHSIRTCLFHRNYIRSEAYQTLQSIEQNMERMFPNFPILYFDVGFPIPYMHMFPHLDHAKGDRIDLGFLWKHPKTKAYAPPPSPFGYGGFVQPRHPRICNPNDVYFIVGRLALDLRWDYDWISPFLSNAALDQTKTKALINIIAKQSNVENIIMEPYLNSMFSTSKNIINSCKVARHDDHIQIIFDSRL